jgi:hypothetical protein
LFGSYVFLSSFFLFYKCYFTSFFLQIRGFLFPLRAIF